MKKTVLYMLCLLLFLAGCAKVPTEAAAAATVAPAPTVTDAPSEAPAAPPTAAPVPVPADRQAEPEGARILSHCLSIVDQLPCQADLDGDGQDETVDLIVSASADGYPVWAVTVTRGSDVKQAYTGVPADMEHDLWMGDLDEDEQYELFFHGDMASDDYVTYAWRCDLTPILFEPDDRCVRPDDEPDPTVLYSAVEGFEDGHLVALSDVDMLGTHWGIRTYAIGDDGIIGPVSTVWSFDEEDRPLIVKKALTAYKAAVRKDPGAAFTLEPGTRIYVTASDGCSRMWFDTENGQSGVLLLVPDEDPIIMWRIDGVPEAEFFESLPYSG